MRAVFDQLTRKTPAGWGCVAVLSLVVLLLGGSNEAARGQAANPSVETPDAKAVTNLNSTASVQVGAMQVPGDSDSSDTEIFSLVFDTVKGDLRVGVSPQANRPAAGSKAVVIGGYEFSRVDPRLEDLETLRGTLAVGAKSQTAVAKRPGPDAAEKPKEIVKEVVTPKPTAKEPPREVAREVPRPRETVKEPPKEIAREVPKLQEPPKAVVKAPAREIVKAPAKEAVKAPVKEAVAQVTPPPPAREAPKVEPPKTPVQEAAKEKKAEVAAIPAPARAREEPKEAEGSSPWELVADSVREMARSVAPEAPREDLRGAIKAAARTRPLKAPVQVASRETKPVAKPEPPPSFSPISFLMRTLNGLDPSVRQARKEKAELASQSKETKPSAGAPTQVEVVKAEPKKETPPAVAKARPVQAKEKKPSEPGTLSLLFEVLFKSGSSAHGEKVKSEMAARRKPIKPAEVPPAPKPPSPAPVQVAEQKPHPEPAPAVETKAPEAVSPPPPVVAKSEPPAAPASVPKEPVAEVKVAVAETPVAPAAKPAEKNPEPAPVAPKPAVLVGALSEPAQPVPPPAPVEEIKIAVKGEPPPIATVTIPPSPVEPPSLEKAPIVVSAEPPERPKVAVLDAAPAIKEPEPETPLKIEVPAVVVAAPKPEIPPPPVGIVVGALVAPPRPSLPSTALKGLTMVLPPGMPRTVPKKEEPAPLYVSGVTNFVARVEPLDFGVMTGMIRHPAVMVGGRMVVVREPVGGFTGKGGEVDSYRVAVLGMDGPSSVPPKPTQLVRIGLLGDGETGRRVAVGKPFALPAAAQTGAVAIGAVSRAEQEVAKAGRTGLSLPGKTVEIAGVGQVPPKRGAGSGPVPPTPVVKMMNPMGTLLLASARASSSAKSAAGDEMNARGDVLRASYAKADRMGALTLAEDSVISLRSGAGAGTLSYNAGIRPSAAESEVANSRMMELEQQLLVSAEETALRGEAAVIGIAASDGSHQEPTSSGPRTEAILGGLMLLGLLVQQWQRFREQNR
jgi:hypothetical protein